MPHRRRGCRATVLLAGVDPRQLFAARLRGHVVRAEAKSGDESLDVVKTGAAEWCVRGAAQTLTFTITVYALDQSVRGSYLDRQRGYFNGPCVFVLPEGREAEPIEVALEPPPQPSCAEWRVATALTPGALDERGFGTYRAGDYDELLDHPVEISDFESVEFDAAGVPHRLVIAGRFESDLDRIADGSRADLLRADRVLRQARAVRSLSVLGPRSRRRLWRPRASRVDELDLRPRRFAEGRRGGAVARLPAFPRPSRATSTFTPGT